jgi:type IV pilus assembly protein PilQ
VFKKAVLGLKVTPQVLPGKMVLLQLQINQDKPSNQMVLGVPTISTRQIVTSVLVKSGQTMVLGGVYETNHEHGEKRVPFLSRMPLLGWLFNQLVTRDNKRELLIFISPTIVAQVP